MLKNLKAPNSIAWVASLRRLQHNTMMKILQYEDNMNDNLLKSLKAKCCFIYFTKKIYHPVAGFSSFSSYFMKWDDCIECNSKVKVTLIAYKVETVCIAWNTSLRGWNVLLLGISNLKICIKPPSPPPPKPTT